MYSCRVQFFSQTVAYNIEDIYRSSGINKHFGKWSNSQIYAADFLDFMDAFGFIL